MAEFKKARKIIGIVLTLILLILTIGTVISSANNERSIRSTLVEKFMEMSIKKQDKNETKKFLDAELKSGEKTFKLGNKIKLDVSITKENFKDMPVYTLNGDKHNGKVLLYIHGGGYISQINDNYFVILSEIAKKTDAKIIVPVYPLAPFHTYDQSYRLITDLYKEINADTSTKKVFLAGDSAGGGLAMGLAEDFQNEGLLQPDELILLSPWVDITMSNPEIKSYESIDPMLSKEQLIVSGEFWAGSTDPKDYRLSPLYGEVSSLKNVTLFVGTRELFYPDVMKAYEKMKKAGVDVTLHVGKGQNHVYPFYPFTPEGKNARQEIVSIIKKG